MRKERKGRRSSSSSNRSRRGGLRCVTPLLLCNEEAVVEAALVYGNFSQLPEV